MALGVVAAALCGATKAYGQGAPVRLDFDTTSFATSGNTPASGVTPWNGGVTMLSDSNVFVSFLGGNQLTVTVGSGTLTGGNGNWTYVLAGSTNTYSSTMSQGFSIAQLKSGPAFLAYADSSRMYISYGTNSYSQSNQPAFTDSTRYSYVELNYKTGGNGVDLSNIEQFGGSIGLKSLTSSSTVTYETGNTLSTQQLLSTLVQTAGGTAAGPTWVPTGPGGTIVRVTGPSNVANVPSPFTDFQPYLANVFAAGAGDLQSPTMTLMRDPYTPQTTAGARSDTAVGALNWSGAIGFMSSSTATGVVSGTTYNTGYFFTPTVTQNVTSSGTFYGLQFTGSVSVSVPTAFSGTTTPTKWYDGLTINVSTGTDGAAINSFLQSGGPTAVTNITLSGTGWAQYSADFSLGSGTANAAAGAPTAAVAGGANSSTSPEYGQVVQKVLGDFQEGLNAGLYANTASGSYTYYLFSNGVSPLSATGTVGVLPSSVWYQNPQFAYQNTGTGAQNTFGAVIWNNSYQVTSSGSIAYGGVYGSPYDDRFGSPYTGEFGNTFALNPGGSLLVTLNEAIVAVPEPSTVALVAVAGAALGGTAWRRRRRRAARG